MVRILIADDHCIVRRGLKQILAEGFSFVHIEETDNAEELVRISEAGHWDIIISDLGMPGGGGLLALRKIREKNPSLKVLILSIHPEEQYAVPVMRAGAWGYLNKGAAPEELVNAVNKILDGRRYVSDETLARLTQQTDSQQEPPLYELLSERELLVFRLLAQGKSITEISNELAIGSSTVSTYRARIFSKMNKKNNAELTRYALENKII